MGNVVAKRRRTSKSVRPIFSPKLEMHPARVDGRGECDTPVDTSQSDCYASDTVEFAQKGNCCGNGFGSSIRVFSFPTRDLKSRYSLGKELRRGRTGVVRVCIDKTTGEKLALKTLDKISLGSRSAVGRIKREAEIMCSIAGHPNVIELKDVCEDSKEVHFVMELATAGDLSDCIVSRSYPYPEPLAAKLFQQIALGVQFIHSQGIVHRDLKPENILVVRSNGKERIDALQDSPLILKLGDFGMAVKLADGKRLKGIRGTKVFLAPEMLRKDAHYGFEVDLWSLGVILYVLLLKEIPFTGNSDRELFEKIKAGNLNFQSRCWGISDMAKELIQKMLTVDPKSRWNIHQVLESPWLKKHCTV